MTPEEHEKYIDRLERNAEEAMNSWDREQRVSNIIWWLFLLGVTAGIVCWFL